MSDSDPRVSIVLPTNRSSRFLPTALDSVAEQTYTDWELILVDNGSPDPEATAAALDGRAQMRLVTARPYSLGYARNAGVTHARGELYVFHDDDDIWTPQRLQAQVEALDVTPDAPAAYVGGWHIDADGNPYAEPFPAVPASADDMLRGRANLPHICGTLMVRREAHLLVGGFAPELPIMEDHEYMLRLLALGTFACVPGEMLGYRRHDDNMTTLEPRRVQRMAEIMQQSLDRLLQAAELRGDEPMAAALTERRSWFFDEQADVATASLASAVARHDWRGVASYVGWGLRHIPGRFSRAVTVRAGGRLSRSARARVGG